MIKRLTGTERVATIVWYQALSRPCSSFPLCLLHWRMPDLAGWLMLIGIGRFGTLAWLAIAHAVHLVDASAVVPFEFLRLPFAALAAYILFGEVPSIWTWLGGGVIFAASIYIAEREARLARQRAAAATAASPVASP